MTDLERLNVSGFGLGNDFNKYNSDAKNYLQELPKEIAELNQLIELDLENTAIKELPIE